LEKSIKIKLSLIVFTVLLISSFLVSPIFGGRKEGSSKRVLYSLPSEDLVPDLSSGEAASFTHYPPDFSEGIVSWSLDLIDAESLSYTGSGVYVAVLDTGLVANWRDYFPEERIATEYGVGFYENVRYNKAKDELVYGGKVTKTSFLGKCGHGTHVSSTIIGYSYHGYPVRGVASEAKIIPVKVLTTYEGMPRDGDLPVVFGTDLMVAAGINYVADLAESEGIKIIINMSLGGPEPADVIEDAIDNALSKGVIVVAAAGNSGQPPGWPAIPTGAPTWEWIMDWPGAYPKVLSVGSCGWGMGQEVIFGMGEWEPWPSLAWWISDVLEDSEDYLTYISCFSSREYVNPDYPGYTVELDVVAPGSWIMGPYPGDTYGYQHIPWWAKGIPRNPNTPPPNYWFVGGTSMSVPHVSGLAAMILEKDDTLEQADVESILKGSATPLPSSISPYPFAYGYVRWPDENIYAFLWADDATGAGIIQADAALAAIP
jgi:subtilisin family serine protease